MEHFLSGPPTDKIIVRRENGVQDPLVILTLAQNSFLLLMLFFVERYRRSSLTGLLFFLFPDFPLPPRRHFRRRMAFPLEAGFVSQLAFAPLLFERSPRRPPCSVPFFKNEDFRKEAQIAKNASSFARFYQT